MLLKKGNRIINTNDALHIRVFKNAGYEEYTPEANEKTEEEPKKKTNKK